MTFWRHLVSLNIALLSLWVSSACAAQQSKLLLAEQPQLDIIKKALSTRHQQSPQWQALISDAEQALAMQPLSVTQSPPLLPGGKPNDYYSVGPYWWPNPRTADGLPWIKRDGERNHQFRGKDADNEMFFTLSQACFKLGLAYYYTDEKRYAEKLQQLVEFWFLNSDTAMSAHLNFAQGVPGVASGRPYGIIEFRHLLVILDSLTLTKNATDDDFNQAFNGWLTQFLNWLKTSEIGREQNSKLNNHGTYYDALVAGSHLYLNELEQARAVFENSKKRIIAQINEQGLQPHELSRTRPFHYSAFNLLAFTQLAEMASLADVDLWRYPDKRDARILKAFDYLLENADNRALWQGKSESEIDTRHMIVPALRIYGHRSGETQSGNKQSSNKQLPLIPNHLINTTAAQEITMCKLLFSYELNLTKQDVGSGKFACTL